MLFYLESIKEIRVHRKICKTQLRDGYRLLRHKTTTNQSQGLLARCFSILKHRMTDITRGWYSWVRRTGRVQSYFEYVSFQSYWRWMNNSEAFQIYFFYFVTLNKFVFSYFALFDNNSKRYVTHKGGVTSFVTKRCISVSGVEKRLFLALRNWMTPLKETHSGN